MFDAKTMREFTDAPAYESVITHAAKAGLSEVELDFFTMDEAKAGKERLDGLGFTTYGIEYDNIFRRDCIMKVSW